MKSLIFGGIILFSCCLLVSAEPSEPTMKLGKYSLVDRDGIGCEAFSMLKPTDWKVSGGIRWQTNNPVSPAIISFSIGNPRGPELVEFFPNRRFFWTDDQNMLYMFPVGSEYLGSEVHPPLTASDYVKQIILPRYRSGISNMKIIKTGELPDFARELKSEMQQQEGLSPFSDGATVTIEYVKNGTPYIEEFYVVTVGWNFRMASMYGYVTHIQWAADFQFSFRTRKGEMEKSAGVFQTMIKSFKLNPVWFNKYVQLVDYLIQNQIQQINNIGQISNIISRTSNEISDMMMDSYNNRQAVYDRMGEKYSQAIRGVDGYYDPTDERQVELPGGYDRAWSNGLGEYILSNDANYNPNIGSSRNWESMQQR